MSTKKRKTKKQQQAELLRFVYALIAIFMSILGLFSLGWIGVSLNGILRAFFGQYPQVIYVITIAVSLMTMFKRDLLNQKKRVWFGLFLIVIAYLLALSFPKDPLLIGQDAFNAFTKSFKDIFAYPDAYAYGGLVGAALFAVFSLMVSRVGTIIVIVVLLLIAAAFILTPSKLKDTVLSGAEGFNKGARGFGKGLSSFGKKLAIPKGSKNETPEDEEFDPTAKAAFIDYNEYEDMPVPSASDSIFLTVDNENDSTSDKAVQPKNEQLKMTMKDSLKTTSDGSDEPRIFTAANVESYKNYRLPPLSLLEGAQAGRKSNLNSNTARDKGKRLIEVLKQFGIDAELVNVHIGPAVTKFELKPDSNVKISRISSIQDNIMMELAVKSLRIEAPIPGKSAVGIEIPNVEMLPVRIREIISNSPNFYDKENIWVALGKNLLGEPICVALNRMPHLLVAGATGSGKSVCMNSIISSILLAKRPDELKLLLIDPKKVEFTPYVAIPHLMGEVVTDPVRASNALKQIVEEMENRYETFSKSGVRNITSFNQKVHEHPENNLNPMPWIVVIIDELADLMAVAGKDVETSIQRITQLARAAGIHLIVATQRPSVDVVTGIIKANIPSRIAFAVSSAVDSRTILDTTGAEKLLGNGDMLYIPMGEPNPTRVQGAYVSDKEVVNIAEFAGKQAGPRYDDAFVNLTGEQDASGGFQAAMDDPLYDEAVEFVITQQRASTSFLQRQYRVGYNRAANIMDALEQNAIIGPPQGSKPREVLYRTIDEYLEKKNGA